MAESKRPSTAEIAAEIDGFYDDFQANSVEEKGDTEPPDSNEQSETETELTPEERLEKTKETNASLLEENSRLSLQAKLILLKRAQGRQRLPSGQGNLQELETRFDAALKQWPIAKKETDMAIAECQKRIDSLRDVLDQRQSEAKEARKSFNKESIRSIGPTIDSNTRQVIQAMIDDENQLLTNFHATRLISTSINSQIALMHKKTADRDRLADGLHLIDFEQLEIENQTLKEKIDERSQELFLLNKKTSGLVQVIAHFKEKFNFQQHQIEIWKTVNEEQVSVLVSEKAEIESIKQNCLSMQRQTNRLNETCLKVTDEILISDMLSLSEKKNRLMEELNRTNI